MGRAGATGRAAAALAVMAALWLFAATAAAGEVTDGGDAVPGTLHDVINAITTPDQTVTFDPTVGTVTIIGSGIMIDDLNLTIKGNTFGGDPVTTITVAGTLSAPLLYGGASGNGLTLDSLVFSNIRYFRDRSRGIGGLCG